MTDAIWETNVTELLDIFREAIRAVLPSLDRARIPWRQPDAYDGWDAIAETLYREIVESSVKWSVPDGVQLSLPRYGFQYERYRDLSFIALDQEEGEVSRQFWAFVDLANDSADLRHARCATVGEDGTVVERATKVPFANSRWCFLQRASDGHLVRRTTLTVRN